ncbi:BglII/BstYI family type II restriction endonuclease [Paenibacillus sp. 23TSA30-6]|uniref:BglII/BstYI family type II restriction endonuclease n=1 Tax=Paenibacillus sp. 23TSA30-6 TaxID=2546104 RepID=UPI0017889AE9|nr:BglII/BstYI family type II restriction endonuclease [Paenibacillus sp. 23TSA30-6]MBE0338713.1 restriction endonuclease [Paenibacillus sp. 23TSA30-6]
MKLTIYSHNFGSQAIAKEVLDPLVERLSSINFKFRGNTATDLRENILDALIQLGWSDQVKVERDLNITITSMNNKVGLCLQLGNMARFYADLLKLEVLHQKNTAECAIYILPKKQAAKKLGSNIAQFERMTEELKVFKHIITIPIAVIGIEEEE